MLHPIEIINQSLLATYTLHVQETTGPVDANIIGHLGKIVHHVNAFEDTAFIADEYMEYQADAINNMWDALDSLKALSEILGETHRLVRTAALAIGATQDRNRLDPELGPVDQYFNIEVGENNNVVSVTNGTTKANLSLKYRLLQYGRREAQVTWLCAATKMRPGNVCVSDIADLLCEPEGPDLFFQSYKAAEQIMEMLEPFKAKAKLD